MTARLIPLGCAGWFSHHRWQTMSFLLEYNGRLIILDAGSGIANLKQQTALLKKYETVHILLSHFHLDHVAGFFAMNGIFRNREVHVYGPGAACYDESTETIITNLNSPPYSPVPPSRFPFPVVFHDYTMGSNQIDGLSVTIQKQKHSNPSCSIRIEDLLLYATDTACTDATTEAGRDVDYLLHECWWDTRDYRQLTADAEDTFKALHGHSHAHGVAEIARTLAVKELFLIHYNPSYSRIRVEKMREDVAGIFPRVHTLNDLGAVILP